ncbi:MAG TPA: hypothetical protein VGG72_23875 [Bryobacteraceae bacterium]|jgi:hypothetical protein
MTTTAEHYDCLKSEIDSYITYSRIWMRVWGATYYSLRTTLIVLSACVAAKETLQFVSRNVAAVSLLVAVGTSLDTWLKTGNRFRGHYTFNDKFIALHTDLELTNDSDAAAMGRIQDQFKKFIDDYAQAVLPT